MRTFFRCFCLSHLCMRGYLRLLRGSSPSHNDSQASIWTYIAWASQAGQRIQAGLAKCELKTSYATIVVRMVTSDKPVKQSDGDTNHCREIRSPSLRPLTPFSPCRKLLVDSWRRRLPFSPATNKGSAGSAAPVLPALGSSPLALLPCGSTDSESSNQATAALCL